METHVTILAVHCKARSPPVRRMDCLCLRIPSLPFSIFKMHLHDGHSDHGQH